MTRLSIYRGRSSGAAECERCDRLHPDSTRERARQHAKQTSHTVRYVIEDVTVYQVEEPTPPRVVDVDTRGLL